MNLKSFAAGVLVGSIGLTTVFAAPISRAINAVYSINAVTVDGRAVQFTEANKPFTVDGTTYLPVRAVAEALGKNVDYDSATATVKITSKSSGDNAVAPAPAPSQEIARNLTVDMVSGYENNAGLGINGVKNWNVYTKDNAGNSHTTGIEFSTKSIGYRDAGYALDVALLGKYSNFKGQFVLTESKLSKSFSGEYDISILADGKEIETLHFKAGTLPQNLDINVSNVQKLSFKFTAPSSYGGETVYYGIVDVTLS